MASDWQYPRDGTGVTLAKSPRASKQDATAVTAGFLQPAACSIKAGFGKWVAHCAHCRPAGVEASCLHSGPSTLHQTV